MKPLETRGLGLEFIRYTMLPIAPPYTATEEETNDPPAPRRMTRRLQLQTVISVEESPLIDIKEDCKQSTM